MTRKKYLILFALAGFIIGFDQVTKMYVHTQFQLGESVDVIRNFFNFTYVRNTGAAFGILQTAEEAVRKVIFLSLPPIAVAVMVSLIRSLPNSDTLQISALAAIIGGAIGNYIDRIRFGYVIDFLDFHYKSFSYPAFNVADSAIVIGISIMIWIMIKEEIEKKKQKSEAA